MKKFDDELNAAVFTTSFVLWKNSPIVYVSHDDDGDWQFQGPENNIDDKDIKIVGLGEIIDIDPTVLEVSDLPYDWEAYRTKTGEQWHKRKKI